MEDVVKDALASVIPLNKEEDHHEKEKENDKKAHKKEGQLFSRLIYGGEAEREDKEQRGAVKEGHQEEEEEEKEEKSGGIITNFISNLVSPLSPKAGQVTREQKHEVSHQAENEDSNKSVETGGGVINNLVSNLFHQSNGGGEKREGHDKEAEENMNFFGGRKKAKIDEVKEGEERGGIIDGIVSHFPTSISDDAAPTTEEASILINSVVKD